MDEDDIDRLYRLLVEFISRGAANIKDWATVEAAAIDIVMALEAREKK